MERTQMNRDEGIRQLAYGLWQEEGCPEGREIEHWLRAQTIWEEINGAHGKAKQSRAANGKKSKANPPLNDRCNSRHPTEF